MFRLRDLKNGFYQIHKKNGPAFEGTALSIFQEAVKMGVGQSDLVYAAHKLKERGHDYADFESNGKLKHTKKNGG